MINILKEFLSKQAQFARETRPNLYWKYAGFEELVLDLGVEMSFSPLPEDIKLGFQKGCYYNSFRVLVDNPDLIYCEGYALQSDLSLPLIHAWLVNEDGQIIDPTWNNCNTVYLGIPFNTEWFIKLLRSRDREDCLAIFESNYLEKFSLLKEGLPDDAIEKCSYQRLSQQL
ncbi:hypothetical protein NIES4102_41370 (plasmid) [Chondrocystis sp. NIES-4102]|nr:hypothetical protein NIES4102_41370 [Chondrocystis sp. NIES-4102]